MAHRTIDAGTNVVRLEVVDGVGLITLNRPERRNALHHDMYAPIKQALADFAEADDVACIVLTGSGTSFCSGGDVRDGVPGRQRQEVDEAATGLLADAQVSVLLHESPKLTIAAVNGPAVGAGLALALACDLRVMARSATFIPAWSRLAFAGDFGGTWFLTRLLGPSKALELLISNPTVAAEEARALGLANHVIDGDDFATSWPDWVRPFAAGPRDAIALMKANVRQAMVDPLATALVDESRRMVLSGRTADHKEAVRAWLDKRDPDFSRR